MNTWVALLRGVNVNGITIRSVDLAALFTECGFENVKTYLASGNVRFEADAAASERGELKVTIESALRQSFGYDAWIVLVTLAELERAICDFPFDAEDPTRQPYVVFGSDEAALDELTDSAASLDSDADPVQRGNGVVYWNPVKGTTVDTAFGKVLAKAVYKRTTTNRNLRTLVKIAG